MVVYKKNKKASTEKRRYWQEPRKEVKNLGNMPKRWSFDKKTQKLYMLFVSGDSRYLMIEKAHLTHDFGGYVLGVLNSNNHGFILRKAAHCHIKQIVA